MDNLITKSHFNYKLSLFNIHTRHRNKVKWRKEFLQQRLSRQLSHESSFVSTTSAKVVILATATSRSSTTDKVDTGRSGRPTLLLPSEKSVIECSFPYSKPPVGGTISYRMKRVLHARNNCNCTCNFSLPPLSWTFFTARVRPPPRAQAWTTRVELLQQLGGGKLTSPSRSLWPSSSIVNYIHWNECLVEWWVVLLGDVTNTWKSAFFFFFLKES